MCLPAECVDAVYVQFSFAVGGRLQVPLGARYVASLDRLQEVFLVHVGGARWRQTLATRRQAADDRRERQGGRLRRRQRRVQVVGNAAAAIVVGRLGAGDDCRCDYGCWWLVCRPRVTSNTVRRMLLLLLLLTHRLIQAFHSGDLVTSYQL